MVTLPISRVPGEVLHDRRDPDGGEAHVLDVIQMVYDTAPGAAAVDLVSGVAGCGGGTVGAREAVGEDLVDGLGPPLRWCEGGGCCEQCC